MDKYEYRISLQEIDQLISEHRFDEAASVANNIDWSRVKNPATLCKISDIYKINKEYAKSRRILVLANEKDPQNSEIIYSLCELTIFLYGRDKLPNDLVNAVALKESYQKAEPGNPKGLILEYKLYKVTNTSVQERISVLEQLKKAHYTARWGYELALCYREAGNLDAAAAECRSVMSSFGGKYAARAQELFHSLTDPAPQDSSASKIEAATAAAIASEQPAVDPSPVIGNAGPDYAQAPDNAGPMNFAEPQQEMPQTVGINPAVSQPQEQSGQEYGYQAPQEQRAPGMPDEGQMQNASAAGINGTTPAPASEQPAAGTDSAAPAPAGEDSASASLNTASVPAPQQNGSETVSADELQRTVREGLEKARAARDGSRQNASEAQAAVQPENHAEQSAAPAGSRMTIGQVMSEWEKIKHDVKAQNDQRREQKILEDTGRLLNEFDETSKHTMLEDIENNVERLQREARQGYAYSDLSDGLTADEKRRAREVGRYETASDAEDEYAPLNDSGYPEERRRGSRRMEDDEYEETEDGAVYADQDELSEDGPSEEDYDNAVSEAPEEAASYEENGAAAPEEETAAAGPAQEVPAPEEAPADNIPAGEAAADADAATGSQDMAAEDSGIRADDIAASDGQGEEFNTAPQPYREPSYQETLFEDHGRADTEESDGETAAPSYVPLTQPRPVRRQRTERRSAAPAPQFISNRQGENPETSADHDYGTAQAQQEEVPVIDPNDDHSTRRWNAASVRRAMEAEKARIAALEEADKARLEQAVEHAGEPAAEETPAEENAKAQTADAITQTPTHTASAAAEDIAPDGKVQEADDDTADQRDSRAERRRRRLVPEEEEVSLTEEIQTGLAPDEAAEEETVPSEQEPSADEAQQTPAEEENDESGDAVREDGYEARSNGRRKASSDDEQAPERTKRRTRSAASRARDGELSEEEKKLFGPIAVVKENQEQIAAALDKISLASYTGNVIITGPEQAATRVAQGLLEIIKQGDNNFTGRIAKAPVKALNKLTPEKLSATLGRIENGALQIEGASSLHEDVLAALHHELEDKDRGLIVIMLDGTRAMNAFVEKYKDYLDSFDVRIDIQSLNDKALVSYGKEYALAKDYSIDDLGQLALSTRIASRQSRDHQVSTKEVREIVDEAISYASRKSLHTLWEILTHKRYDEDDRIIIHEKDFMHY